MTLGVATGGEPGGGVAFWAHVGGFIAGIVLLFVLRPHGDPRRA
jgi:membrane associated rhomboid family serine protease